MQRPTCTGLRIRSPLDAHVIFHAVATGLLPIVSRRLDTDERRRICSGNIFVWEERGPNAEATGLGIERWTDSIRWGPSRVRDEFLFYHERDSAICDLDVTSDSDTTTPPRALYGRGIYRDNLVKQTYSVFVETPRGRRKWHLIAYFTPDSVDYLRTIEDIPELIALRVPPGQYVSARCTKWNRAPRTLGPVCHRRTPYPMPQPTHASAPHGYQPHSPTSYPLHSQSPSHSPHEAPSPTSSSSCSDIRPYTISPYQSSRSLHPPSMSESRAPHRGLFTTEPSSPTTKSVLAPLTYLENLPPRRRHPIDERALMAFNSRALRSG